MSNDNTTCRFDLSNSSGGSAAAAHSHDHTAGGHSHSHDAHEHGHTHEQLDHPGLYHERPKAIYKDRDWSERAFTVGIGGPVGSGKTALMLALCQRLREKYSIAAVTNDIFTKEDTEFLVRNKALPEERIKAIETGGCPHAAIREDVSANMNALEILHGKFNTQLLLIESGGDNLAANYSRELADYIIYVIDVAGGDKVPRKGGPGITQSDLLIINKTDLAEIVGADLDVMARDAKKMRGNGPTVFAQVKNGVGMDEIISLILGEWRASGAAASPQKSLASIPLPPLSISRLPPPPPPQSKSTGKQRGRKVSFDNQVVVVHTVIQTDDDEDIDDPNPTS